MHLLVPMFIGLASLTAAPAAAQYIATPVVLPAAKKLPLQGVVWACGGTDCIAANTTSRPETVCAAFVRKAGAVRAFSAGGVTLDPAALEKCNERTRN